MFHLWQIKYRGVSLTNSATPSWATFFLKVITYITLAAQSKFQVETCRKNANLLLPMGGFSFEGFPLHLTLMRLFSSGE